LRILTHAEGVAALPSGAPAALASASFNVVIPREISKSEANIGLSFTRTRARRISSNSPCPGWQVFRKFTCILVWGVCGEGVCEAGACWPSKGCAASKIVSNPLRKAFALRLFDISNFGKHRTAGL